MYIRNEAIAKLVRYIVIAEQAKVDNGLNTKIEAIKMVREFTGASLVTAKNLVEAVDAPMVDPIVAVLNGAEDFNR